MTKPYIYDPGNKITLNKIDPVGANGDWQKESAQKRIKKNAKKIAILHQRLFAENRRAVLLVLQGMDTSGKDGTIRNVMRGVNPQGCSVNSFKRPGSEALDHDYLWRIHHRVPRRGDIGIFNRSHYEDVLAVRVMNLVPQEQWSQRYDQINEFEKMLSDNGTTIVKCFLHISKERQRERLQARLDDPEKHWKFSKYDLEVRKQWDDYQLAYQDALTRCNTAHAPWHLIPSDKKWYRNLVVSELLLATLQKIDPQLPEPDADLNNIVIE